MTVNYSDKCVVVVDMNTAVGPSISLGNLTRRIITAVIYDQIFPVLIGLVEDALNAFLEVSLAVMNGGNNADQW
jgi:hypothetical protein